MITLLRHELMFYIKNKQEILHLYAYFVSILLLLPFAASAGGIALDMLAPMAIWAALASCIAMGAQDIYKREAREGKLTYYPLLPIALEGVIIAKWLGFYVFICALLLGGLPLAGLLFNLSWQHMAHYALGLAVGGAALSMLASLVAAITSGLEKAGAFMALLICP